MKVDKNKFEVSLLHADIAGLVAHYQPVIEVVVSKFIARGFFDYADKMDVVQQVNEVLLEKKMDKIKEHYNGSVLLSTYFSKVVYNLCIEISRSKKLKDQELSDNHLRTLKDENISVFEKLILADEINRLRIILKGVIGFSTRIRIALKLYTRTVFNAQDLKGILIKEGEIIATFRAVFFNAYDDLNDKQVYEKAIPLLNKISGRATDADSMRKWLNMLIDRIIDLQNGNPPRARHTRETIKLLLQRFYDENKK